MNLYLMRHGDAESSRGKPDYQRALTARGVRDAQQQGLHLAQVASEITHIYHSPYQRATQTAELVNEALNALPMKSWDDLVPGGSEARVLDRVSGKEEHILLVCHLPIIAEIALELSGEALSFFPGTIARFQRSDAFTRTGSFSWLQHP